jgi:anthranilate phosphoribosyltransferase
LGALASFIKTVGRGTAGSRALSREQAAEAFALLLDGRASAAEAGAFTMALRMKGEALDELCGFLDATQARSVALESEQPVVVLPSANGARRLPNLTPLLALALARAGVRVLVHSPVPHAAEESRRLTTPALLGALGIAPCRSASDVHTRWHRGEPAFATLGWLCPPLQPVLDLRWDIGVRGPGHSIVKMLAPLAAGTPSLRVVNHTHPEFGALMRGWAEQERSDAMLLRGLEGEPVLDPRKPGAAALLLGGIEQPALSLAAVAASSGIELPMLAASDADGRPAPGPSARFTDDVLAGRRPLPAALQRQIDALVAAAAQLASPCLEQRA